MRAIAVLPGKPNSIDLAELPKPLIHEVPDGRGRPCEGAAGGCRWHR